MKRNPAKLYVYFRNSVANKNWLFTFIDIRNDINLVSVPKFDRLKDF